MDETEKRSNGTMTAQRQEWLRTLACSTENELAALLDPIAVEATDLRKAEVGLTLVTGRVGGTGEAFGLGEMTITRCVVQVGDAMGVGYIRGRAPKHARSIAVADAMLQGTQHDEVIARVVRPLAQLQRRRALSRDAQVAGTQVQFLTMVRGA
jgi:alpha-D-ribose 1-methylphosphonate 5-triphosphate synthase subunit PhnG